MKIALTILTILTLAGCSRDNAPGSPTPPATTRNSLTFSAMVVDESGACIVGATVRVVRGQALGQEIRPEHAMRRLGSWRRLLHRVGSGRGDDAPCVCAGLHHSGEERRSIFIRAAATPRL
jgi:hypothetical protein